MTPEIKENAATEQERADLPKEYKDHAVKKLSRAERIREETKRALEYNQVPKRPLSLHPTFRVEGLVRVAPITGRPPGARFLELARMKAVSSRHDNPLLRKENASYLTARIDGELQRLTPATRAQHAAELLDFIGQLQIADPHSQSTLALRRKTLIALFGERLLKSEQDLPKERDAHGRGGSAGPEGKGRE
jgi:hypothetical protein